MIAGFTRSGMRHLPHLHLASAHVKFAVMCVALGYATFTTSIRRLAGSRATHQPRALALAGSR